MRAKTQCCDRVGREGSWLPGRLVRPSAVVVFAVAGLLLQALSDSSVVFAQDCCSQVSTPNPTPRTLYLDIGPVTYFHECQPDWNASIQFIDTPVASSYAVTQDSSLYPCRWIFSQDPWGSLAIFDRPGCPFPPVATWTALFVVSVNLYNHDLEIIASFGFGPAFYSDAVLIPLDLSTPLTLANQRPPVHQNGFYIASVTIQAVTPVTNTVTLVDAQAFGPQLSGPGVASLETLITDTVDASYNRAGALTDGASLIVVQVSTGACRRVTVSDPANNTLGAAQLGSLWHGDNTSLPPLPATLSNPGTISVALGAGESAVFYRPPPSWAFGKDSKTHDIQFQLLDQNNNAVVTTPFALYKLPLVLVHGWISGPDRWSDFTTALNAANFQVDYELADYAIYDTAGLDAAFSAVPEAISQRIGHLRVQQRIAATRLDVVAHSMGGLLTRWYMTSSAQLPNNVDRGANANPPLLFKTMPLLSQPRPQEYEFHRADNFGIGDIRRFITLGTPHTGSDWCVPAIGIVNAGISRPTRPGDIKPRVWSLVEQIFKFHAIPVGDPAVPGPEGMALIDLAAYGTHPLSGDPAPPKSVALGALPPVPVLYAPAEGIVGPASQITTNAPSIALFRLIAAVAVAGPAPSDLQLSVSDAVVPSASARNLNPSNPDLVINGVPHWELPGPNPRTSELFEQLLGSDESLFIQP